MTQGGTPLECKSNYLHRPPIKPCMKEPTFNDNELGRLLSLVIVVLVLCVAYLVILLPFSGNSGVIGGAIAALTTLIGGIVGVRAIRRNKAGDDSGD